mgnify:CR=1 FL=1
MRMSPLIDWFDMFRTAPIPEYAEYWEIQEQIFAEYMGWV